MNIRNKVDNAVREFVLNISTRGVSPSDPDHPENIHYGTVSYSTIERILDHLNLGPSDVFVDLGCGKGRVLCCAARRQIGEAIGVEYAPEHSEVAERNAVRLRGRRSPIRVLPISVQEFDFTTGTVFYMFHPFGPNLLREVVDKIHDGWMRNRRGIRVVYVNPVHEDVLRGNGWIGEYERWEPAGNGFPEQPVSFWRTK